MLPHTSSDNILRLAAASSRIFFRPSPHFLVAATARQLGQWALTNNNYEDLREAFYGGIDGLFNLCVLKVGLTLDDIRRMHARRFTIINPASDMIDRCAGKQWYDVPDFWDGGRSDANTIDVEPERSLFQFIIYGEFFNSTCAFLNPSSSMPRFDLGMRLDYIKYCIPDYMCSTGYEAGPDDSLGMHVLPLGPYTPCKAIDRMTPNEVNGMDEVRRIQVAETNSATGLASDPVGLNHILNCRTWREAWEKVHLEINEDFNEEWRQKLWNAAVQ